MFSGAPCLVFSVFSTRYSLAPLTNVALNFVEQLVKVYGTFEFGAVHMMNDLDNPRNSVKIGGNSATFSTDS